MKYFWKDASGVNADVERHRSKQRALEQKIAELEQADQSDPMVVAGLIVYRRFLYQLELSKAEVVSKIGKK